MEQQSKAAVLAEVAAVAARPEGTRPTAEEMALIRTFALAEVAPEALYVRRMVLANDAVDRSDEQFPPAVLSRLAETLPGKPLLVAHQKEALPTGLVFRARARQATPGEAGTTTLEAWFYLLKTEANAEIRAQIDAGVARYVSIGFLFDARLCSVCDQEYWRCPHVPGQQVTDEAGSQRRVTYRYGGDLARYEACEASLVYLGCQRLAQLAKEAFLREEGPMEVEKLAARLEQLEARLAADGTGGGPTGGCPLGVADGETAALAADGRAYRSFLREEAARLARLSGSEKEAALLLAALPQAPAAQLQQIVESYRQKVDERFPPRGLGALADADPGDGETARAAGLSGARRLLRL
jgi:hypothetical protein